MHFEGKPIKHRLVLLLFACALVMAPARHAHAAIYDISYSGTFTSIFDINGNPCGSFNLGGAISIGDTFSGTFSLNTDNAGPGDDPPTSSVVTYDFGVEHPSLTLNGAQHVSLKPKVGLGVFNNVDPAITTYLGSGVRESGFDPLPASVDFLLL